MKQIPLTRGLFALVDDADFYWLNQWKWTAQATERGVWYAVRMVPSKGKRRQAAIKMHCQIMGSVWIDHKDCDGLNNQRHNLRPATNSQNQANRRPNKNTRSGFKGVSWNDDSWMARIQVNGKRHFLGEFPTSTQAAIAYDEAAIKYFGEFARVNFPESNTQQTSRK